MHNTQFTAPLSEYQIKFSIGQLFLSIFADPKFPAPNSNRSCTHTHTFFDDTHKKKEHKTLFPLFYFQFAIFTLLTWLWSFFPKFIPNLKRINSQKISIKICYRFLFVVAVILSHYTMCIVRVSSTLWQLSTVIRACSCRHTNTHLYRSNACECYLIFNFCCSKWVRESETKNKTKECKFVLILAVRFFSFRIGGPNVLIVRSKTLITQWWQVLTLFHWNKTIYPK